MRCRQAVWLLLLATAAGCTTVSVARPYDRIVLRATTDDAPLGAAPGTDVYYLVSKGPDGAKREVALSRCLVYGGRPLGFRWEDGQLAAVADRQFLPLPEPEAGGYIAWARQGERTSVYPVPDPVAAAKAGAAATLKAAKCAVGYGPY